MFFILNDSKVVGEMLRFDSQNVLDFKMIQRLLGRYCDSIPKMFLILSDSKVVRKILRFDSENVDFE